MVHKLKMKDINKWARNIAYNYNKDIDTNILSQLIDAKNDLGLNWNEIDKRWQFFSAGDKITAKDIKWLLTGKRDKYLLSD